MLLGPAKYSTLRFAYSGSARRFTVAVFGSYLALEHDQFLCSCKNGLLNRFVAVLTGKPFPNAGTWDSGFLAQLVRRPCVPKEKIMERLPFFRQPLALHDYRRG
jgi:hypothetical protein